MKIWLSMKSDPKLLVIKTYKEIENVKNDMLITDDCYTVNFFIYSNYRLNCFIIEKKHDDIIVN